MSEEKYRMKQFCPNLLYLVFLDKINFVVFWTGAQRFVRNLLLDYYEKILQENLDKHLIHFMRYNNTENSRLFLKESIKKH